MDCDDKLECLWFQNSELDNMAWGFQERWWLLFPAGRDRDHNSRPEATIASLAVRKSQKTKKWDLNMEIPMDQKRRFLTFGHHEISGLQSLKLFVVCCGKRALPRLYSVVSFVYYILFFPRKRHIIVIIVLAIKWYKCNINDICIIVVRTHPCSIPGVGIPDTPLAVWMWRFGSIW